MGYIRRTDLVSLSRDQQLGDAKQVALGLARFYKRPKAGIDSGHGREL